MASISWNNHSLKWVSQMGDCGLEEANLSNNWASCNLTQRVYQGVEQVSVIQVRFSQCSHQHVFAAE